MSISYSWVISQLECYVQQEDKSDVVFNVNWRRIAKDDSGHIGYVYGAQIITLDPTAPFTPYDQITEEQVIGWLEDAMGVETLAEQKASMDAQIEAQVNPVTVVLPLPWG